MAEQGCEGGMFRRLKSAAPELGALERAEALVRARFAVPEGELVLVSEEPSRLPGQPGVTTTALFWKDGERYRLRLFKPVAEVTGEDLPPRWLAGALRDEGEADCC